MPAKTPRNSADAAPPRAPMRRTRPPRNWRAVFLRELTVDGNRRRAAEVARVDSATIYRRRAADAEFRSAWDQAIDHAGEYLEAEAFRRATEGWDEPLTSARGLIYDQDGNVATVRKYSDSLLALLLRGARPQKYRENVSVVAPAALGVTVVLESMQRDPDYAARANELVRLIAHAGADDRARGDE